jgi:hypothetical protein
VIEVLTQAARRSRGAESVGAGALSRASLAQLGFDANAVRAQLDAGRWRLVGRAVVLTRGALVGPDRGEAALINCGPRAVLTAFSAAEAAGLVGWERPEVHVLVPRSARVCVVDELDMVVHRSRAWNEVACHPAARRHRLAPALIVAAASFDNARPACALLAAAVQQRLARPEHLRAALADAGTVRHRAALSASVDDIAMGAQALSEIDFVRLCRANRLPPPVLQAVRPSPDGRRRYLDAEWVCANGRRVVVEVDGAIHLRPLDWARDQLRQNEIVLSDAVVLRFPAVVVRTDPALVVAQLRRALNV